jgi:hypothetical protein
MEAALREPLRGECHELAAPFPASRRELAAFVHLAEPYERLDRPVKNTRLTQPSHPRNLAFTAGP